MKLGKSNSVNFDLHKEEIVLNNYTLNCKYFSWIIEDGDVSKEIGKLRIHPLKDTTDDVPLDLNIYSPVSSNKTK